MRAVHLREFSNFMECIDFSLDIIIFSVINATDERNMQRLTELSETNLILRTFLQLGRQHEGCHYIAVRLVGIKVLSIGL